MTAPNAKPDYGRDAPGIMAGLLLGGAAPIVIGAALAVGTGGWWRIIGIIIAVAGLVPFTVGVLMLVYGWVGKARTRDHMLAFVRWRGDETVLDIGTGAGLLLVGAAKRLTTGAALGIDIWSAKDLTNNAAATTTRNAAIEGVASRTRIMTGDARQLAFPAASFDYVFSLLCLHNIDSKPDQARACREIARVLKPGGRAVIGDYVPTHAYAEELKAAGLHVLQSRSAFATAWSLMWILVAEKPGIAEVPVPNHNPDVLFD